MEFYKGGRYSTPLGPVTIELVDWVYPDDGGQVIDIIVYRYDGNEALCIRRCDQTAGWTKR